MFYFCFPSFSSLLMNSNITITNAAAVVYQVLDHGGHFDTRKKSLETRNEAECF